jgi:hypothetical protein
MAGKVIFMQPCILFSSAILHTKQPGGRRNDVAARGQVWFTAGRINQTFWDRLAFPRWMDEHYYPHLGAVEGTVASSAGAPSIGPQSHSCTALCTSLAVLCRKYTQVRGDDFTSRG